MKANQYVITSTTGDSYWHGTKSNTLRGAKSAASRMYQASRDSRIEVGFCIDGYSVETISVKRGYGKWEDHY